MVPVRLLCAYRVFFVTGLENQQRFQINGAAIEKFQGFYAATSADLQDVISALVQKHTASGLPSVAAGWIEVAGSNNAYLVASFHKVAVSGWVVQGPFAGTGLDSSSLGTSVQFVQSGGGAPIGALITVAADLPVYTGWVVRPFVGGSVTEIVLLMSTVLPGTVFCFERQRYGSLES